MTRHWHPSLERIARWLKPSGESFAAAAAVYGPDLMLQPEATAGVVVGGSDSDLQGRQACPAP